ncbi:MAG: YgjV family protein [Ardenticatenaceae bacterium]|nr:YgjV family protein [Anaerolineales bacterium]MCB8939489.1 YgjV family protein [Ardenticatenaceae bacterium]MCB8975705.1 YgjV family protein [Ardenticatenaceae bacterium]
MDFVMSFELLGYMASVFVAVSLMMRSLVKLRVINLVGAVLFTVYGLIIAAYPVAVVNGFIVLVNIYYLQQTWRATAVPTPQM